MFGFFSTCLHIFCLSLSVMFLPYCLLPVFYLAAWLCLLPVCLSLFLTCVSAFCFFLMVCLSTPLSVSVFYLSLLLFSYCPLSNCPVCLAVFCFSLIVCLPANLSVYLCLPFCLSTRLSVFYLFLCRSLCLPVLLTI